MSFSRRTFVKGLTSLTLLGSPFASLRAAQLKKRNLVVIMLRGGLDGLDAVPAIDPLLSAARPDISLSESKKITSDFLLHPSLKTFHELWNENKAAVVHSTNIPYTHRSHFEGQNLMETGGLSPYADNTGWLGRGMEAAELEGLAVSLPMPLLLRGNIDRDNLFPSNFGWMKPPNPQYVRAALQSADLDSPIYEAMRKVYQRDHGAMMKFQGKNGAGELAPIAAEQLANKYGPRVAVFEISGFDTHAAQGGSGGTLAQYIGELDSVIEGLRNNLGDEFDNTLIITLTEFGRRLDQNGGFGTEHGYGTAILMAGGLVKSSQVFADWPGLSTKELFEGQDLNATIDARAVYCSAMSACFDIDFAYMRRKAFWNHELPDLTEKLFRV